MLKRLRIKIICVTMAIVAVMLSGILITVYHFTEQNLREDSLRMMEAVVNGPSRPGRPNELPGQLHLPYFVLTLDKNRVIIEASGGYYDLSDGDFLAAAAGAALAGGAPSGEIDEYGLRYMTSMGPEGMRIVFADMSSESAALNNLLRTSLLIGLGGFIIFFGISFLFAHMAVKPVEQAWEQQRQFVADASHELKTPLTVIITCTELLKSPEHSGEEKKQFLDSIQSMGHRMRTLTESLLTLARMDAGSAESAMERLELSALVQEEAMLFEPVCFEKGLGLCEDIEPGVFVRGCEGELRRLAGILLDNAVKYSAAGAELCVSLKKQGTNALLSIKNPGEAISPEDLKNIFKRFYRLDRARSGGSYGLGLSIAEGIVRSHRGKIWAESSGGVNKFNVLIPINKNP